jgi:hypothetical protein
VRKLRQLTKPINPEFQNMPKLQIFLAAIPGKMRNGK